MHVKEVVIDGFKSYATRTVISGWDSEFNAITGLNGSGKSNILDAICFVLGITTLSHVRAANLQDLVYKRGQAGINKASVSIVFDNSDRQNSPVGYEEYKEIVVTRQVIIGGKNKFLVNGHLAQQQVVANLFQSVQLNVNNPHFLIMQGKITKVLNMKPPEILSMIEEAAGTRMFEERRDRALKTMEKKQRKVEEVQLLLNEEIRPELEKLRAEKAAYLEFQKVEIEKQRLERLVVAWEYSRKEAVLAKSSGSLDQQEQQIKEVQDEYVSSNNTLDEIERQHKEIVDKKNNELSNGGKFHELEHSEAELKKSLTKLETQCEIKAKTITEETENLQSLRKSLQEYETTVETQRQQHTKRKVSFEQFLTSYNEQAELTKKAEERFQTLSTGLSAQEGHENGYMEQIQTEKAKIAAARTETETNKNKLKHCAQELTLMESKHRKFKQEHTTAVTELDKLAARIDKTNLELKRIQFEPEKEASLQEMRSIEQKKVNALREEVNRAESQVNHAILFDYTDPTPNFDRSRVKGLVAGLIDLAEVHYDKSTALEICAGGRLFNVIVQDEVIASQLLKNGRLRRRVTIIPLNKIQAWSVSTQAITIAQDIAPGQAHLALDLIGYDEELTPAMKYIFGGTFICADSTIAQQVTFHPKIKTRTVTLQGDVYEPSGVLSGGAKPNSSGLLVKMQHVRELKQRLQSHQTALVQIESELSSMQQLKQLYSKTGQEHELLLHQKTLLEQRIAESEYAQLEQTTIQTQSTVTECKAAIENAERKAQVAREQVAHLEKEMAEYKGNRTGKLKEMEKCVKQSKIELNKRTQEMKSTQREVQTSELELTQAERDVCTMQTDINTSETQVENLQREYDELRSQVDKARHTHKTALDQLTKERLTLSKYDRQLKQFDKERKTIVQSLADLDITLKQLQHTMDQLVAQRHAAVKSIHEMLKQHTWIAHEKGDFGQPNTPYSFDKFDAKLSQQRLKELSQSYEQLKKKVNTKVMDMIGVVEKREANVFDKLKTVQADKLKIEETISKLDTIKKQELEKTWRKVNKDFGAIFGELLPGNTAKLEPPEGKTIMDGLEVKVCLGNVWKESLTELSGGQRCGTNYEAI